MLERKIKVNAVYCLKDGHNGLFILSSDNGNGTGNFIDHLGDRKNIPYELLTEAEESAEHYPEEWRKI